MTAAPRQTLSFEDAIRRAAACHRLGQLDEALSLYGQLQAARPEDPNLSALVGTVLAQMGRGEQALPFLEQALRLDPGNPETLHNLSHALAGAGLMEQAADRSVEFGRILSDRNDPSGALAAFDRALGWFPGNRAAAIALGSMLQALGRHAESIARLSALVGEYPDRPDLHGNLGNALLGAGDYRAAAASFRRALALDPGYCEAESNLGLALAWQGEDGEEEIAGRSGPVERCYRRALILQPDFAAARWNRSLCLLLSGDFERGWAEYEWRWRWPGFGEEARPFPQPVWRGEPPAAVNGTILVTAEQGLGDTLQFARYLPLLAERGHDVAFEVQSPLFTLLWSSLGGSGVRVVPRSLSPAHVHDELPFAAHVSLMSLPERFATGPDSIPAAIPYLHADPLRRRLWRDRLDTAAGRRLKIGLVWRGRPSHRRDGDRSLSPARLAPLLAVPGAVFFSLHKDPPGRPPDDPPGVVPLGSLFHDFGDAAAAAVNLDLIVSVDTAAAHLAGGLGVPVWTLLPFSPDWRWMLGRSDSPWYPTMTLFRQQRPGDWDGVIAEIAARLADLDPSRLPRFDRAQP
ncbi:tetratricopeptide (TPR) repeat protein [Azospirillum agricola]|uniref:tetratricopeptide repeat protein n=1 Tax=Azospirillum agricola TaxID=1720247 RepID=UPI001AE25113|nr:tetratricopeptide repeat protein [Azospirillum agricola]MBP2229053.1 tetratricopeptide (TPR) repeat protein [Azospirillum agricola]